MARPILYGFPLSQPSRVVQWFLALNEIEYDFQLVDLTKAEQLKPKFLALNPNHTVPTLVDKDGTIVTESNAILLYLREKYGDKVGLLPGAETDLKIRIRMLEFISWYPGALRAPFLGLFIPLLVAPRNFGAPKPDAAAQASLYEKVVAAVTAMNDIWLKGDFIAGPRVTVADMHAYSELQQLFHWLHFDFSPYENVWHVTRP